MNVTTLAEPPTTEIKPTRILVADDQPFNIEVVGSVLGEIGYEIIAAPDGPTALKRLALRSVDLILLDMLMPGMDGCEVCRRVRENPEWRDIPIIFLSAADEKDMIVRALESGGMDYITKPFNHAELLSRVRTHLALKNARDQLKQLAEDKDELIGILTHDLKSHLGGMQMSAEILRDRLRRNTIDPRAAQLAENIFRSGSQMLAFVKEFLANAAADHEMNVKLAPLDLAAAASTALQNYQNAAQRKQLSLEADIPDNGITAWADASALNQVMDNLLSNAIKFSPLGKRIFVAVRAIDGEAEFLIRDQGPGFTDEDKLRMFHRYRRLSARPTGGEPSTGLGLSIVKKLVRAMHGTLTCESVAGEGAKFILRLPCQPIN